MVDQSAVGRKIRQLRDDAKISQKELARLRNLSQATVALQENGKRSLGEDGLMWYADYFGVSVDYILGRTSSPNAYDLGKRPPLEDQKQLETALQCAIQIGSKVTFSSTNFDLQMLVQLIRQIVDQTLAERDSQNKKQ